MEVSDATAAMFGNVMMFISKKVDINCALCVPRVHGRCVHGRCVHGHGHEHPMGGRPAISEVSSI